MCSLVGFQVDSMYSHAELIVIAPGRFRLEFVACASLRYIPNIHLVRRRHQTQQEHYPLAFAAAIA